MTDLPPAVEPIPPEEEATDRPVLGRILRLLGVILLGAALLLVVYGGVAYLAWQNGQHERQEQQHQAQQENLARQMSIAQEDVEVGNFSLALRRLEWVLSQNPDYPGAENLRQRAQQGLNARLTPTATPLPTVTPVPEATLQVVNEESEPEIRFRQLSKLMNDRQWEAAVSAISAFQFDYPNYRRRDTNQMLYEANMNLGLQLLPGKQVELGLFYLDQAEKLGDLPQEVLDQREWAEVYLQGIGFYGVDWQATIFHFRGLCQAAPFYQNACQVLAEALVGRADQYAAEQDWCPAQPLYNEALGYEFNREIADRRDLAVEGCLSATPTPETITDTVPITNTVPVTGDQP